MIVAGSASPLLLSSAGGYNLTKSLRFRSSASAYLNRTLGSSGSLRAWTWSAWVKRGTLGVQQDLFGWVDLSGGNFQQVIGFNSDNTLEFQMYNSALGGYVNRKTTTQVFRDPSAWYHIVVTWDSNNATADDRARIYINGTRVTAWANNTNPSLNQDSYINNSSYPLGIGRCMPSSSNYFDGYLAEINFVNAQALDATSFGQTSPTTGVWQPIKYTGTYGTNGFYLPFTDVATTSGSNAGLGKDFSGNGNYWTTNNISITSGATYDSMTDVPTLTSATAANYAVMNPLDKDISRGTVDNGNLRLTYASFNSLNAAAVRSTLGTSTGKWYFECVNQTWNGGGNTGYMTITSNTGSLTGVSAFAGSLTNFIGVDATVFSNAVTFRTNGLSASLATGTTLFASYASGDVINFAFDLDAGKIWIGKNGTWYNSGNPSAGTNHTSTFTAGGVTFFSEFEATTSSDNSNQSSILPNFGQRPFAYTPPSGFVALNTFNLPTPTIGATASSQANKYFDATTYAGNNTSGTNITNSGSMQPDFVWIKNRTGANNHILTDAVRGATKTLFSDSTSSELTIAGALTAFNSNGFQVGYDTSAIVNASSNNYVGWQWRASNTTAVTNTAGSITSTVSANTTAGFSIVTFTAPSTSQSFTVGHGLGVAPSMVIKKRRDSSVGGSWWTWHIGLGDNTTDYLALNTTDAEASLTNMWGTVGRTSTLLGFNVTASCVNSETSVVYCFAQVAGYSAFGSYTGNGSTDGPFVFTGFRPKFILIKRSDAAGGWKIYNTSGLNYNPINTSLETNDSASEATSTSFNMDWLSNGFKIRTTYADFNTNGGTYIYMAFAESPFKYANAR